VKAFPNGIGGTTGDSLATADVLHTTGDVWYVHSGTGADAASPAGKQRTAPLATLAQAMTNAADGDDIVFLSGHAQTLTAVATISKVLRLIGEGSGSNRPRFTRNHASAKLFDVTAGPVELRNLFFPADSQTNATATVTVGSVYFYMKDCYFERGATNTGPAITTGANDGWWICSSTFVSTSTTTAPYSAMTIGGNYGHIVDCILDGGTKGWSNQYALDNTGSVSARVKIENISLLNDSDIGLNSSTQGSVTLGTCSGSARVVHA